MKRLNRNTVTTNEDLKVKVVQFGEGNFLRAFVDFAFHTLNENSSTNIGVAVVQPIDKGLVQVLNEQDGIYTLFTKGYADGKVIEEKYLVTNIISGINPYEDYDAYLELAKLPSLEFIISNTTEAGIAYAEGDTKAMRPPTSYPAKLTALLYERYQHFGGAAQSGLAIIPCELINYNADTLKSIVLRYAELWELEAGFLTWIEQHNSFHNTLVDRIVPGYPKDNLETYQKELDYEDKLIVTAEHFFLWVIEGGKELKKKLPFEKTSLDVKIVKDMQPYRTRKVRILNGAHTCMVPFGILYGHETVKEAIDHVFTGDFVKELIFEEVIPTMNLPKKELNQFANDVFDRFRNPFIKHKLSSIALNSISKFKVRVLPSLLQYVEINGSLPVRMAFSMACLIRFYKGSWQGGPLPLKDEQGIIQYFSDAWKNKDIKALVTDVLAKKEYWGQNLNTVANLPEALVQALEAIEEHGIEAGYHHFSKTI